MALACAHQGSKTHRTRESALVRHRASAPKAAERRRRNERKGRTYWKLRKRREGSSAELSDTRRRGSADARRSTPRGEEAVSGRRSIATRNAAEAPGAAARWSGSEVETGCRRDEHPRCHGRQVSPPPAGRTDAARGGLRRTAARRRICIRRAAAWTRKPPGRGGKHGCGETCRATMGNIRLFGIMHHVPVQRGGFGGHDRAF